MTTGLVDDERFLRHRAPYEHPEHPGRLEAIRARLEREDLAARCRRVPAREATDEELRRIHTPDLLALVDETSAHEFLQLDPDTYTCRDSALAARLAAGGLIDLCAEVAGGRLENGFALLRPPGHHAEAGRAMGFCLFNNVAVAAKALQAAGAARRVLVVDWDLHHGNGTQHSFWEDPSVLYFSTHQFPFYPGTGAIDEVGAGAGRGFNVNVAWGEGMGDAEYLDAFDRVLLPIARRFAPDFVLVSCGFDAADGDPLGGMRALPRRVRRHDGAPARARRRAGGPGARRRLQPRGHRALRRGVPAGAPGRAGPGPRSGDAGAFPGRLEGSGGRSSRPAALLAGPLSRQAVGLRPFQDQDVHRRLPLDLEVPAGPPLGQEVPIAAGKHVARLARREDVSAADGPGEVDDLPVARALVHLERPVLGERPHVDGRAISALPDLEIEKPPKKGNLVEDVVGKNRAVEALPPPA